MYGHGGEKKQDKKSPKWASSGCFAMYSHGKKQQQVDTDARGDQRELWEGIEGNQEARGALRMFMSRTKQKKQTTASKKTKTSKRKLIQPGDLYSKKSKHGTSQKKQQKQQYRCNVNDI